PPVDAAVVADVEPRLALVGADRDRVLIGVRRGRAPTRPVRRIERVRPPAREVEVPVRADGRPVRAAVLRLVDLLETREDVVRVGRVDGQELVVPGLDSGAVALA